MKRLAILAAAVALAVALAAGPAKSVSEGPSAAAGSTESASGDRSDEARTDAERAEAAREARLRRRRQMREYARVKRTLGARQRRETRIDDMGLKDALQLIGELGKFGVVFDPHLEEEGIDLSLHRVTLNLKGLSIERVLLLILPQELGYRVGPGYVLITTLERSWLPLQVQSYSIRILLAEVPDFVGPRMDIGALMSDIGGGGDLAFKDLWQDIGVEIEDEGKATPERIVDIILQHVRHENDRRIARWEDEGGPATIQYIQGRLVISQTLEGHRAVMRLLARLGA
jgi:hypothetical protein